MESVLVLKAYKGKSYSPCWILSNGRTGSTYLAEFLNRSNMIRGPRYAFGEWFTSRVCFETGANLYYDDQKMPPYAKVHRNQFLYHFKDEDKDRIEDWLPGIKYILLRRKDVFAHTVSVYISEKTEWWVVENKEELDQFLGTEVIFDKWDMLRTYDKVSRRYDSWDEYLKGSSYLEIEFDNLFQKDTLQEVLDYLGINDDVGKLVSSNALCRMTRPETQEYIERLRELIANNEYATSRQPV